MTDLLKKLCKIGALSINASYDMEGNATHQASISVNVNTAMGTTSIDYESDWHGTQLQALQDIKNMIGKDT